MYPRLKTPEMYYVPI